MWNPTYKKYEYPKNVYEEVCKKFNITHAYNDDIRKYILDIISTFDDCLEKQIFLLKVKEDKTYIEITCELCCRNVKIAWSIKQYILIIGIILNEYLKGSEKFTIEHEKKDEIIIKEFSKEFYDNIREQIESRIINSSEIKKIKNVDIVKVFVDLDYTPDEGYISYINIYVARYVYGIYEELDFRVLVRGYNEYTNKIDYMIEFVNTNNNEGWSFNCNPIESIPLITNKVYGEILNSISREELYLC